MNARSEKRHLKFTVVGHVDHGKSTLIGRLLYDTGSLPESTMDDVRERSAALGKDVEFAFIMDHLSEEREKGITIDTAQTWFHTDDQSYVIIDAPGHKEFLKNMLTGASQAEAALLLVDADEGPREQTMRHAYLLGLLGLEQVSVMVNKMDLVEYSQERFEALKSELLAFLEKIGVQPIDVVPVSAKLGENIASRSDNMPWYEGPTVLDALASFKSEVEADYPFRYSVQDIYDMFGESVLAGRLESGVLDTGRDALLLPEGQTVKIQKIRKFEDEVSEAAAGECLGVVLDNGVAPRRGQILCDPERPCPSMTEAHATIFWMSPAALAVDRSYTINLATQKGAVRVKEIRRRMNSSSLEEMDARDRLEETETAEVVLSFEEPVLAEKFTDLKELGRFVFEHDQEVVAAGIIVGE